MAAHSKIPPVALTPAERAMYVCTLSLSSNTGCRHLRVMREDGGTEFPWWHLQLLKDEYFGEDSYAVEVFPPARDVVDVFNFRHLWEVIPGQKVPAQWLS